MANRERSSENPDEIAASIRAKNADKKNTNKKQNSGNQNKKGGNNSEKVQPHWKIVRNNQRAEKNRSKADELRSQQELMQENVNTRKVEIRTKKELIELDAELAILNAEALKNEVKVEQEKPVDVEAIKVEVIQTAEDVVKETRNEQVKEIEKAVATGQIGVVQAEAIRSVLFDENTKQGFFGRLKDRVGDWSAKHPRLSSFLVGMGAGAAVRGAVKAGYVAAFGANLPFAIAAGATAGGLLEGGKALFRESKAYQSKEIMEKFNQADYLEKAALLTKLEELHKNQKFDASPEEYNQIKQTLDAARLNMQTELAKKDGKFANYSEKDKIEYLLGASQDIKNNYAKSDRGKEVQVLLNRIERNIAYKRDFGNVFRNKKAIVGKAILRGAAYGAFGSTVGAALVESADKLWNSGAVIQESTPIVETRANLSESYTNKLDHRGLTGGARDAIHTFIEEHKGVNANFASGVTIEQLVYAEDTLVKEALRQGIDVNSAEFTVSSGYVEEALEKAGVIGENAKLTEAGIKNIGELIQTKAHFLSEATKAKMLDFDPVAMEQFITETITESKAYEGVGLTADDFAAWAPVVAAAVLASEVASRSGRENNTNENSTVIGGVALGGTPGNRGSENPPVTTPPASTPRTGDKPKGPDSPDAPVDFDWGKALSQDTETDGEEKEKAEPEKEKLSQAEAEFNQALIAAGINAEVHIDGNKKFEKQIDKIQYIVDEFIKSAKKLRTLNINTKIVLNMSSGKQRTLVSSGDSVIVGIPVFSKIENNDIESLVDRVIDDEISKKFSELEANYDFKVKITDEKVFDQLSVSDQYLALNRLSKSLDQIEPGELKRITKGLKTISISDYNFVDRDEVNLQLMAISNNGFSYSALKPAEIVGLLRESYKDRTALEPMNREEQFAKYPSIKTNQAWANLPESKRVQAEEIMLDIINRKFPEGLPSDVKITMGNKFQMKPGVLMLDLSKPDEEYIVRQLNVGLRRADPDRLNRIPKLVKERFERKSKDGEKKEEWPKIKEIQILKPIIDKKNDSVGKDEETEEETVENNGLDQRWVDDARARVRNSIPKKQIEQILSYMSENKIRVEDLLSQKDNLPKITSVVDTKLKNYIRHQTLDKIESLIKGSDSDKKKAHQLRDMYLEFIKK